MRSIKEGSIENHEKGIFENLLRTKKCESRVFHIFCNHC